LSVIAFFWNSYRFCFPLPVNAELTARKKQYHYYRDQLLSFDEGEVEVEWKTLGEVAEYSKTRISFEKLDELPCVYNSIRSVDN
jgi:hypothetical protein